MRLLRRAFSTVYVGDTHIPDQDGPALDAVVAFLCDYQPDNLVLMGDIIDFAPVSSYMKTAEEEASLVSHIEQGHDFLQRLRVALPKTRLVYLGGNHEGRLRRYVLATSRALSELAGLQVPNLLGLKELGVEYIEPGSVYDHDGLVLVHGDIVRSKAGVTATAMLERYGVSGLSGHSHRAAKVSRTNMRGDTFWIENGCLQKRKRVPYVAGLADWHHAFSVGHHVGRSHSVEVIVRQDDMFQYAGSVYGIDTGSPLGVHS